MSILAVTRLLLLASAITAAVLSAAVLVESINASDARAAWMWGALFMTTSLIAALFFGGLV